MYYIYMIRCEDNTIYTGITTDIVRRFNEHKNKEEKGAKYTKTHQAVKLEALWETENRAYASKLEYRIKKLSKIQKEDLIKCKRLKKYFLDVLECDKYKYARNKMI